MNDAHCPEPPDEVSTSLQGDLAIGSTAVEKLCIAIISAHPNRDRNSRLTFQQRVRDAVFALQGYYAERGSNKQDDIPLLLKMAEELNAQVRAEEIQKQISGPIELMNFRRQRLIEIACDSHERHTLARRALQKSGVASSKANLKRLTGKFEQDWRALLQTLGLANPVPHSNENRCMQEIVPLLVQMGIPAKLPGDPDIFWPLSSDK